MSGKSPFACGSIALGVLYFLAVSAALAQAGTTFTKFAPVPPCSKLVDTARTNGIPLEGFDAPSAAGQLDPGDSITGLITLHEKGGRQTQWLIFVRALAALPQATNAAAKPRHPMVLYSSSGNKYEYVSSPARVSLRTLGPFEIGRPKPARVHDNTVQFGLDKGYLSLGLDGAAAVICRMYKIEHDTRIWFGPSPPNAKQMSEGRKVVEQLRITAAEERALGGGIPALFSYMEVVQNTEGLEEIMMKVINKPSVWSLVRHMGITVNLRFDSEHCQPANLESWRLPGAPVGYDFPMDLELNQQPALRVTLVVTSPLPPLLECGGIIGMLAEKPGDAETYLTLRIISARHVQQKK